LQVSVGVPTIKQLGGAAIPASKVDVARLYAALDSKRQVQRLSWRQLAQTVSVPASTFTRMSQGLRPDVDAFTTLLRWLGMRADDFIAASETPQAEEDPEPMAMISTYLRSGRNVSPETAEAMENILRAAFRGLTRDRDP
jgi:transcriptional regulator with XRE-family HTH domain